LDALGLEIQALFSTQTNRGLTALNELIVKYSAPLESGGFRPSDFYKARTEAFSALYSELELTGDQLARKHCVQLWRLKASSVVTRRVRRLVNFVAYALPIYAAIKWYPSAMEKIDSPPLGFFVTLAIAVVLVIMGQLLEECTVVFARYLGVWRKGGTVVAFESSNVFSARDAFGVPRDPSVSLPAGLFSSKPDLFQEPKIFC
jgi:hypothetical protein